MSSLAASCGYIVFLNSLIQEWSIELQNQTNTQEADTSYPIFYSGVLGTLKSGKFVSNAETDPYCDTALAAISEWAEKRDIDLRTDWVKAVYNGAQVAALTDFMEWISTWKGLPQLFEIQNVTLSIQIPSGKGFVTFAATAICDNKNLGAAYTGLYDYLIGAYETIRQKRNIAPAASSGQQSTDTDTTVDNTEQWETEELIVKYENGKPQYRIAGGRWTQFGVACYPETFERAGVNLKRYNNPGTYNFEGYTASVELKSNGKPNKIISLGE